MASIDVLIAAIHSALNQAAELVTGIGRSTEETNEVRDRLAELGVEDRATLLSSTSDHLSDSQSLLAALTDRLRTTLAAAESARHGRGTATGHTSGPADTPRRPPATDGPAESKFHPRKRNRGHEEEIRKLGWPKNSEGRISARGRLYGTDGTILTDQVWKADPHAAHADLREPWASSALHVARWHVEGQVTGWMRAKRVKEAVLYLNLPACGRTSSDPGSCDKSIAAMLPEGSSLVVWTVPESGSPYSVRYRGTGEAIK